MLLNAFNNQLNKDTVSLSKSMLEFIGQVELMSDVFNHIAKIGAISKELITDASKYGEYEYKTYTGQFFGNLLKAVVSTYLTQEQHDAMFKDITICNAGASMLAMSLKNVKNALKNAKDEAEIAQAYTQFTQILNEYLVYYTGVIGKSVKLEEQFNALSIYVQEAIDTLAQEKCQQTLGGLRGHASRPFQHLMRIPLLLSAIVNYADKCDPILFKGATSVLENVIEDNKELVTLVNKKVSIVKPQ